MLLKRFLVAALVFAPVLLMAGRPAAAAAADDEVVATVAGRKITLGALKASLDNEAVTHLGMFKPFEKIREEALRDLIDRELMYLDARKLDLRRDPDYLAETEAAVDSWLAKKYIGQVAAPASEPTLEDLKPHTPPRFEQVHVRQIAVATAEEAAQVRERLVGGADFAELAREVSIAPTAASGGELGWLVRWGRHFYSWDAIEPLYDLEPGSLSPVLKTELGYEVFQVLERTPLSPEDVDAFLSNPRVLVQREKLQAHLDGVYRAKGVVLDEAAAGRMAADPALPRETVVGSVGPWKLTAGFVRAYVGSIANPQQRPPMRTPEQARNVSGDLLRQKALRLAMEEHGFFKEAGNREKIDAYLDKALGEFYMRRITGNVALTDADRKEFFRARPEGVMLPPKVRLRLITVNEEDRIRRIHAQLVAGKSWDDLAKAYSVDASSSAGGDLGWVPLTKLQEAYLGVVEGTATGTFSAPFAAAAGKFVIVRVDGREESRRATEEEALPLLELEAFEEKKKKAVVAYLDKLEKLYPVKTFPQVIQKVRMPERKQKPAGAAPKHH